ncbi:hypothetical protein SLS62_000307 [Diatrype stigma]|uniref:Uncharacterized protein n=1 Tax=Diatrype stigma TaxID=117547 RepID=A0AAN9UYI2_9PEZI
MLLPRHFSALLPLASSLSAVLAQGLTESSLERHVDSLALDFAFSPVKEAYWTGLPHHRRTPFAVSPDGSAAYLAYLDASGTGVHVQGVDPSTFAATGATVTVAGGREAGGLVAHDDGSFALLTNEALPSGTADAPPDSTPVPVLYRYGPGGALAWKTFLGGPGVHADFGLAASPDLNGDLAYSASADLYGAYFVVTAYTGEAAGHYGDSVQYVSGASGAREDIAGASSSWGCSHNTGIALAAADAAPFASVCAEDQGALWLNTDTQTMAGVKVSNENTTNGAGGESLGGMSGSYSALARLPGTDGYVLAWVSRGAVDLTENAWLGAGYTSAANRTNGRNIAIAQMSSKNTLLGAEATSEVGAADGDSQVNWITTGTADNSNAHVAAFGNGSSSVLVTWEEIAEPQCEFIAMGCRGAFTGAYYQLVDTSTSTAQKVGEPLKVTDTFVAGDMVAMPGSQRICWPYVAMDWDLSEPVPYGGSTATTKAISFACVSLDGSGSSDNSSSSSSSSTAASAGSSTAAASTPAANSPTAASTPTTASASTADSTPTSSEPTTIESSPTAISTPLTTTTAAAEAVSSPTNSGATSRPTPSKSHSCRARARRARRAQAHE